jgi:eukaryotic-like serine/threonine-protein kinase
MTNGPQQIGAYPVEREIGRGGMGIVYLARDPELHRQVAIKVLPDLLARDPERLARFEREARLLASLNHPNIAAIYGIEESGGHRFLVLEYVEGETLAERLARGALPVTETLDIGRQIAAALEAAHESGVIHRDLKPANVKLTPGGDVKVLDFGLAKGGAAESSPDLSHSPTIAYNKTEAGVILGTAAYMSPEQARGKSVDRRTDIWSLGCVLYECLTGRQLFAGETVSDMIARILEREPDWNALPAQTPEKVRELLRRMLDKDAKKRQRDIGDARIQLEEALAARTSSSGIAPAKSGPATAGVGRRGAVVAGAFTALAAAFWMGALLMPEVLRREPAPRVTRFSVPSPPGALVIQDAAESAISPDGRMLAFSAADSAGNTHVWVRSLDGLVAHPIAGTANASLPFWSPDARWIGFFADGKLKKAAANGGAVEVLCDAKNPRGGTWNRHDLIIFAPDGAGPLFRVSASGGEAEQVTTLDSTKQEGAHRFPAFLPDGKHFLYTSLPPRNGKYDVWAGSLDSRERRLVMAAPGRPAYANPGYLLYIRGSGLVAQKFDSRSMRVHGQPIPLPDVPSFSQYNGYAPVTVSDAGDLAYTSATAQITELTWLDRSGRELGVVRIPEGSYQIARASSDGRFAAVVKFESPLESDIWIVDLERAVATRFTFDAGLTEFPLWSPSGDRIAFQSSRIGLPDFFVKSTNGASPETTLQTAPVTVKNLYQWSSDGRWITYEQLDGQTGWDIYVIPADGKGPPVEYLRTPHNERWGAISPDGRWMAYASDETGQMEIYVQSYPKPTGTKYRVSMTGGGPPIWRSDGRELAFLGPDFQSVLSSQVTTGASFHATMPRPLFRLPPGAGIGWFTRDLERYLVPLPAGAKTAASITVALNGAAGLAKR